MFNSPSRSHCIYNRTYGKTRYKLFCVNRWLFLLKAFLHTSKRALTTMKALMSDCDVDWMPNYILHMNIDASYYYMFMCYKSALLTEWLLTHTNSIKSLTNMYALMGNHIAPNPLLHIAQAKGRSPIRLCWCVIKLILSLNGFLHKSQV